MSAASLLLAACSAPRVGDDSAHPTAAAAPQAAASTVSGTAEAARDPRHRRDDSSEAPDGGSRAAPDAGPSADDDAAERDARPTFAWATGRKTGTIACGKRTCAAGLEACDGVRCIPLAEVPAGVGYRACDDSSDCPSPLACCHAAFVSASFLVDCSERPCEGAESCAPPKSTNCPTGLRCVAHEKAEESWCEESVTKARCGDKTCRGATTCIVTETAGRCGGASESSKAGPMNGTDELLLGCAGPSDCAPGRSCCLQNTSQTASCSNTCDITSHDVLCETHADCARYPRRKAAPECAPMEGRPAWVKHCVFE